MSILKVPLSILIRSMAKGDQKFSNSHKTFGTFNVKKDLNYLSDGDESHCLDIYTNPTKRNGITLFYIHGGGYVHGSKNYQQVFASWFVDKGFDVVVINYRLGEKDGSISVMDQVRDSLDALKFIEENKHYYGIKTNNLFLMGDSAGGHICLMLDILLHDKSAQDYYELESVPGIDIKGIALNSTMYDFEAVRRQAKSMLFKSGCKWMLSNKYIDDGFININNPQYHFEHGFKPLPLFASTSYHDYFNSHTLKLARDCKQYGIDLDFLFEASTKRNIGHVYNHFHFEEEEGKLCNQRMADFFIKHSKVDN